MPYAYYAKLGRSARGIYRASDRIATVPLRDAVALWPAVGLLERALGSADRVAVERAAKTLAQGIATQLDVPPVRIRVLAARPAHDWGELHGEYRPAEDRRLAVITVWMRTARHKRVVAFRTLLRTLLHELCHHCDYELFGFADSLHTEGFFKRESSLFKQLVTDQLAAARD